MNKSRSEYAKYLYEWAKRNPEKSKKLIKDTYKKSLPNGEKDFIKFQSRYIDQLRNYIMETEIQHFIELENARNTNEGFDYENLINKDGHQRVVEEEVGNPDYIDAYVETVRKWLATKTEQQKKIWELYNDDIPKKRIAKQLNKDDKYIRVTIKNLEKSFMDELSKTATPPRP